VLPITKMEPLPLPPPPPAPKLSDLLNIVEDENSIDEELEIKDADDNSDNLDVPDADNFWKYDAEGSIEDDVFVIVEDLPQFPGGNVSKWIAKNVHYPAIAEANGIEGKVYVKFIIERDGSVTHVEIMRGADSMLDKEAIRVISAMPKWKPGKQRGKAVRVSYTLPISFRLNH
ncbi:MAG: energy transducer TonB, partial [Odoribacter sp.]|nr:energy transducer TonB [Odoribacter sp.]